MTNYTYTVKIERIRHTDKYPKYEEYKLAADSYLEAWSYVCQRHYHERFGIIGIGVNPDD